MKKILLGIIAAAFVTSLYAVDIFSYVPVTGNFKNYTQIDYSITTKFGNYFRTPSSKVIHTLNTSGKEVETSELTPKDVILDRTVSKYDVYGNLIEQATYDSDSVLLWNTVITYKGNQRVDCSEYGKEGTLKAKTIYSYDSETGLMSDETGYDGDGALIWKTVYKYAEKKLDTVYEYYSDGSLSREEKYTYTSDGKIESITTYDVFTESSEILVFRYSSSNLLTEITTYGSDKQITKRQLIKYDSTGNVAKVSDYDVAEKFGTTVNELVLITEYIYQ